MKLTEKNFKQNINNNYLNKNEVNINLINGEIIVN